MLAEMSGEPGERLHRTHDRVPVCAMADLFTTHGILLVEELQGREGDSREDVLVIQRRGGGVMDGAINGEVDVFEEEGLRPCFLGGGEQAFGGSEQPEEGDNDEVNDVTVEGSQFSIVEVKGGVETADDGDGDWVDSTGWVVPVSHCFGKSSE